MDRGRSRSRHRYDYDYDYNYRSPSYSRSPSPRYAPRKLRTRSATRATNTKHSALRTTAGLVAGVGLATLAIHKLLPKDKDLDDRLHHYRHHGHDRGADRGGRDPRDFKDRLRRQGDDIVARNRHRNFEEEDGPVHPRTTVRRRGDSVIYEDVVPARDVDGGWRGHRAMEANGFERISRGRSLDGRGRGPWRDDQQYHPDDRHYARRNDDRHYPRQHAYIDDAPRR